MSFLNRLILLLTTIYSLAVNAEQLQNQKLVQFIANVNSSLSANAVPDKKFCQTFWDNETLSLCEQIPWKYASAISPNVKIAFPLGAGHVGFLDFINLSYNCQATECRLGLDLLPSWKTLSANWNRDHIFSGELISAEVLDENSRKFYSIKMQQWLNKISSLFSIKTKKNHQVFLLNNAKIAVAVGFSFPPIVSGGSRGDHLVFIGQHLPPSWLLHELVHSYTAFPGKWWSGPGHFPHAILNEGLAVSVQLQEIWNDLIPAEQIGNLFCNDLQVANRNLNGQIFRLFDNNQFRSFDSSGYHPSYLVGSSVINSLIKRKGIPGLHKFWLTIGKIHNPIQAAEFLNHIVSEKQLSLELKEYFRKLAFEIHLHSGVSCLGI